MIATPDAQMRGAHRFQFALTSYRGDWRTAGLQPLAHAFAYPPVAYPTNGHYGANAGNLSLARFGDASLVPSALHRSDADGSPLIRVYSTSAAPGTMALEVPAAGPGAARVDLLENHTDALDLGAHGWPLALRPWEIGTVRFGRAD